MNLEYPQVVERWFSIGRNHRSCPSLRRNGKTNDLHNVLTLCTLLCMHKSQSQNNRLKKHWNLIYAKIYSSSAWHSSFLKSVLIQYESLDKKTDKTAQKFVAKLDGQIRACMQDVTLALPVPKANGIILSVTSGHPTTACDRQIAVNMLKSNRIRIPTPQGNWDRLILLVNGNPLNQSGQRTAEMRNRLNQSVARANQLAWKIRYMMKWLWPGDVES